MSRTLAKSILVAVTSTTLINPLCMLPAFAQTSEPALTIATSIGTAGASNVNFPAATALTTAQKIALLRQKVKYVFVIFQENRSFDHYFGTYPGANGLFSTYPGANPADAYAQPATAFSSFSSVIRNVDGTYSTQSPFLVPRSIVNQAGATVNIYPENLLSVDHSHTGYINDMHADLATKSIPQNDGYPLDQEGYHYGTDTSGVAATIYTASNVAPTGAITLQAKQKGEIVMGHLDCDTIPFLWQYADRFTMFDNMHQTATGPSTPNAIAMIAGQTGDTQWAKHPANVNSKATTTAYGPGPTYATTGVALSLPNITDSAPFPGSINDTAPVKPPYGPDESTNVAAVAADATNTVQFTSPANMNINLTFASLPLSFMGNQIGAITAADQSPATDLVDVQRDIQTIATKNANIDWGWYQQGYGAESFDGQNLFENAGSYNFTHGNSHASYIVHHNGPQYFGYIGDNTVEQSKMHGLTKFFTDVNGNGLSANGGVYYVRGGYYNNDGMTPINPNLSIQHAMPGNDDHANYSDSQISEAMVADAVNAIASSPYWSQSAIVITYDESDGFYDHQPEQFRTYGPDGQPETGGPRIPLIVVSPYSVAHGVSHVYSEHSSVIKFVDELFNLVPLSNLPDEVLARAAGAKNAAFNKPNGTAQQNLGPADTAAMGDLLEAFDNDRLAGVLAPLPASYAMIPAATVTSLPHYGGAGCTALGITPTDYTTYGLGLEIDPPPADFNPRPTLSPGSPYYNTSSNTTAGSATGTGGPWGF